MLALRMSFAFFRWTNERASPRARWYHARRFRKFEAELQDASDGVRNAALRELLQDHQAELVRWTTRQLRKACRRAASVPIIDAAPTGA